MAKPVHPERQDMLKLTLPLAAAAVLGIMRVRDAQADRREWSCLGKLQPDAPSRFDPCMVADLPAPARRFFAFAIAPGAPLFTVAVISMEGQFSFGTRARPRYRRFSAREIVAAPQGFVWSMRTRSGPCIDGTDAAHWTRFWTLGFIPIARLGGSRDHARSSFGRYVAEAVFWSPASMLPGPGIAWEPVNDDTARVTVTHGSLAQAVDITVAANGQPTHVEFQRWSNANPDKMFRWQPFGGVLSDFRETQGFRLPFHVEAGNMFGTDEYFPFFIVDLTEAHFPHSSGGGGGAHLA